MPVMLAPPYTRSGPWRTEGSNRTALTQGPRFIRTRTMGRWHRPRSGVTMTLEPHYRDRVTWTLWCGPRVNEPNVLKVDELPDDGVPVCGTCEGRALGAGQDDNTGPHDLIYLPTGVLPPAICPGANRLSPGLFTPTNDRWSRGICLVCGVEGKVGGGYRGAYNWSPLRMRPHPPGPDMVPPCPFHAWDQLEARDGVAVCACTPKEK